MVVILVLLNRISELAEVLAEAVVAVGKIIVIDGLPPVLRLRLLQEAQVA